jgi:hypothetical protein
MATAADIKASLDAVSTGLDNIVADEAKQAQSIADLQAQLAAGSPITAADLQALADQAAALASRTQGVADAIPD